MRGADFGHHGTLCTLETMVLRFGLADPTFQAMGEIVHEIDLRNGAYVRPETSGIDAILKGWLLEKLTDQNWKAMAWSSFKGCMRAYLAKHELEANPMEKNAFDSLKTFSVNSFVRKRDLANGYTPLQHVLFRNRTAE